MNLPRKDKNGNGYLSYSQINTFLKDRESYKEIYIDNKPFEGNEYTSFGSKVGEAIENNIFDNFDFKEQQILKKVVRLDEFERRCMLKYDDFYVVGYIDSNSKSLDTIIDYKTGGIKKEKQYTLDSYTQLCYYALALRQETGITPEKAYVNFIRRSGNLYRGEKLSVSNEEPLLIEVDISVKRLKKVYNQTKNIALDISKFHEEIITKKG